jgi:CubicO group peptidase (beta-lactamase class C family)
MDYCITGRKTVGASNDRSDVATQRAQRCSANIWAMGWPILAGTKRRAVGGIGGDRSTYFVYPDDDVAVVVMTNLVGANPQNLVDTIAGHYIATAAR